MKRSCRRFLPTLPLCLALFAPAACLAQVSVTVTFDASADVLTALERAQLTSHSQAAGQRWGEMLGISQARSIELEIGVADISTANGASIGTAFVGVIEGRNTFEQGVAHELRTGVDPNGSELDARFNFGLDYLRNELWFDPDPFSRSAPVPQDRTDAMGILLHEFGHAIAYNGWADGQGIPPVDFWSPFDRWMQPGEPTLFAGPASVAVWGSLPDLTTNNIMHWGNAEARDASAPAKPAAIQWRNGLPVPPMACGDLLSISQPDSLLKGAPPPGLLSELMNGVVIFRGERYDISALDLGVLEDVGLPNASTIFDSGFEPI